MSPPISLLSAILGDDIAAGLVTVVSLAINTINDLTGAINQNAHKSYMKNQGYDDYSGSQEGQFQSVFMSVITAVLSTINSTFSSLTSIQTPLTTYLVVAILSFVAFKIVFWFVSWVVISLINLVRTAIVVAIVLIILWFVINISSGGEGVDLGNGQRHQDPISQLLYGLQSKFRAEYERQQEFLHQQHMR